MGESSARVLKAIQPGRDSIDADELDYPDLHTIIKEKHLGTRRWQVYGNPFRKQSVSDGALFADDITDTHLLQIAYRIQKARLPIEKKFWSKHYTKTSVNLYGKPQTNEVATIASLELDYFEYTAGTLSNHRDFLEPVISGYKSLAVAHNPIALSLEERYKLVLASIKEYYMENYEEALACFNAYAPDKTLEPYQLAECFYRALYVLECKDKEWSDWAILFDDSAKLSVDVFNKRINIGKYRSPVSYVDARGLFAHEVLVHALRSVNGGKVSRELAFGLPGYLEAEEGFGVLVESAINGRVANKVKDRYIDIALALGSRNRQPITRHELFNLCYTRGVARGITENRGVNLNKLEEHTWEHVNRIYRGTLGNDYVGVFTKDVTYYKGFCKMADYLLHVIAQGKTIKQGLDCLLQGKFDPSHRRHAEHAYSKGIKVI
jgi:hypothetical protein